MAKPVFSGSVPSHPSLCLHQWPESVSVCMTVGGGGGGGGGGAANIKEIQGRLATAYTAAT